VNLLSNKQFYGFSVYHPTSGLVLGDVRGDNKLPDGLLKKFFRSVPPYGKSHRKRSSHAFASAVVFDEQQGDLIIILAGDGSTDLMFSQHR